MALVALVVLAACGGGSADGAGSARSSSSVGTPDSSASVPIIFEALETRCDELAPIAVALHGGEPDDVRSGSIPPGVADFLSGTEVIYQSVACDFIYEGETQSTPNRVRLGVDRARRGEDPTDVREVVYDRIAGQTEVAGIGDAAKFSSGPIGEGQGSLLAVLVGDAVVTVQVGAPEALAEPGIFEQERLVAAADAFLAQLDLE